MDLEHLIKHPELLDKETLYDLRSTAHAPEPVPVARPYL